MNLVPHGGGVLGIRDSVRVCPHLLHGGKSVIRDVVASVSLLAEHGPVRARRQHAINRCRLRLSWIVVNVTR